mgnify:CR=1 FL=1
MSEHDIEVSSGSGEFPGDDILLERTGHSLGEYRAAPSGEGPLSFEWSDKPHRLIYDLIEEVKRLRGLLDEQSK